MSTDPTDAPSPRSCPRLLDGRRSELQRHRRQRVLLRDRQRAAAPDSPPRCPPQPPRNHQRLAGAWTPSESAAMILTSPVLVLAPSAIVSLRFALTDAPGVRRYRHGHRHRLARCRRTRQTRPHHARAPALLDGRRSELQRHRRNGSFSVTVSGCGSGFATPLPPSASPETISVLAGAWTPSESAAMILTSPVLVLAPSAIVSLRFALTDAPESGGTGHGHRHRLARGAGQPHADLGLATVLRNLVRRQLQDHRRRRPGPRGVVDHGPDARRGARDPRNRHCLRSRRLRPPGPSRRGLRSRGDVSPGWSGEENPRPRT